MKKFQFFAKITKKAKQIMDQLKDRIRQQVAKETLLLRQLATKIKVMAHRSDHISTKLL